MDKLRQIITASCDLIDEMTKKCATAKDIFALADLIQAQKIIEEHADKHMSSQPILIKSESEEQAQTKIPQPWNLTRVESEIKAAETYYHKWKETGTEYYKEMAEDELRHADIILSHATDLTPTQAAVLKRRIQTLAASLESEK